MRCCRGSADSVPKLRSNSTYSVGVDRHWPRSHRGQTPVVLWTYSWPLARAKNQEPPFKNLATPAAVGQPETFSSDARISSSHTTPFAQGGRSTPRSNPSSEVTSLREATTFPRFRQVVAYRTWAATRSRKRGTRRSGERPATCYTMTSENRDSINPTLAAAPRERRPVRR